MCYIAFHGLRGFRMDSTLTSVMARLLAWCKVVWCNVGWRLMHHHSYGSLSS